MFCHSSPTLSHFAHMLLALSLCSVCACARAESSARAHQSADAPIVSSGAPSAAAPARAAAREPGENPFGFPSRPLAAAEGDYALVPSRSSVELALEHGADQQTFVYLGARLERLGPQESTVRYFTEQRAVVPNAFIVPIAPGQRANAGDVVLTSWASGSGLQRAIVVSGGSPESPKVRYLDLSLDNPAARADTDDVLPPNTFQVIREPGQVGSSAACRAGERVERLVLLKREDDEVLGIGFAGKMQSASWQACSALPVSPSVKPKQRVYVASLGGFVEADVEGVEPAVGRVLVRRAFGGATRVEAVGFTNVALTLPPR